MNQESPAGSSRQPVPSSLGEGEDEHGSHGAQDTGLQFLNFSNFKDTKAKETKSRVRSHVMQGVHQQRKSGKQSRPRGSFDLDTSLLRPKPQPGQQQPGPEAAASPSRMGAGRNDPFQQYPIEMNQRTLELYDHLRGDFCPMFQTMSKIGFFRSITDPAGFLQILCTSVSHMTTLQHQTVADSPEAIALSTQAIQSVNKRLGDPVLYTSDGIVAAILTFCCHTTMFNDVPGSKTHIIGLEEIIRRRGGLGTLNANPALRMVLFWVDTNYAFMTDTLPRFPYPDDLIPGTPARPHDNTILLLTETYNVEDLTSAIYNLYSLNQLIIDEAEARDIWKDGVFEWNHIVPALHKLLLIRHEELDAGSAALRSGSMLYIAAIRRRFGIRFLTHVQIRRLRVALSALLENVNYSAYEDSRVMLWMLVLGSTLSFLKDDHDWFVSQTAQHIFTVGCPSWDEVKNILKTVIWLDHVLITELEALRQEVSGTLRSFYLHEFS